MWISVAVHVTSKFWKEMRGFFYKIVFFAFNLQKSYLIQGADL